MKKSTKVIGKAIAVIITIIITISPFNVIATVIGPQIEELFGEDDSIGASESYIASAEIQADDLNYYPETADRIKESEYYYNLEENQIVNFGSQSTSSEVVGDPMVFYTQRWLNQEYGDVSGFGSVTENGKTGWDVVYGLLRALQYELGITSLSNNFGNQTSTLYSQNQLSRNDGVTDSKYAILQCALWCKGYCPGYNFTYNEITGKVSINAVFDEEVEQAVIELKKDAGFTNPNGVVTLNVMKALMSMDSFKLLGSSYGAKAKVRAMQQEFNRKYESYIGLIPCDGVYGRSTNSALIYAYQAEEGLPVGVANGNFGPTTRNCAPDIPYIRNSSASLSYSGNYYTDSQISTFVKLLQFALFVNGFGNGNFNGNYDSATKKAVEDFQYFYKLFDKPNGKVDIVTWMSLFLSSGDPNRSAKGADCAMIINEARAKTLYNAGYRYVGRYLTGTYGSDNISKALTVEEEQIILDAGLRFFPIYQDGGTKLSYFTESQGTKDAQTAIQKAISLGIPKGTIIYFAVDFDVLEYQVNSNVIPYFRAIHNEFSNSIYKVGIYGTRNACTLVANAGYSCSSFVADMSTGFSGNLGYPIPNNWAFSQFANLEGNDALGSGEGRIEIDKDAVSGHDQGVESLDITYYDRKVPDTINLGEKSEATMQGPTINLFGKEVNLFELNIGFDIPSNGFHMEYCFDEEAKTTKVIIGSRINGSSTDITGDREKVNKFNEAYKEVKSVYYSFRKSDKEFTRRFNDIKGSLYDCGGKVGFNATNRGCGYIEFDSKTGTLIEGGFILMSEMDVSVSYPIAPLPAVYLKFQIVGTMQGEFQLKFENYKVVNWNTEISFSVQPNLGLEANVIVARAYAGVNGTIDCTLKFPVETLENNFTAKFNAAVFFEYNAFIWANRWEWDFYEKRLFPKESTRSVTYSISKEDLKFIEPIPQNKANNIFNESSVFKNNMQIYCSPQITDLGNGKLLMTYIDDSTNRSAENRTILMYSIFENNQWTTPQPVLDDDTADFEPSICPDGKGGAHIIWQNANKLFDDTVTLEEMSCNIDLMYTYFDGSSFENTYSITDNNSNVEMMHKVVSNGNDISVVWVQNSENDTFCLTGTNSVFRKEFSNGNWNETETIDSNLKIISSLDTSYDGSKNIIAYATKTSDDTSTADDLEIYYFNGSRVKQLTDDNNADYSLTLLDNELYWISGNSLSQVTDGDIDSKIIIVENMDVTANRVKALKNFNGNKAVMWEQNVDDSSTFYITNYSNDTESFNSVEPLSDTVGSVRGWDACMLSDGQVEMTYGVVQENNTISLMQRKMNQFYNITVDPTITYDGIISNNGEINILANVYNTGSLPVSEFDVNIYNSNNELIESLEVDSELEVGSGTMLEIPYTLPPEISRTDYSIEILPKDETDISLNDNKGIFSFGFADVSINDIKEVRTNEGRELKVTILNKGFDTANDIKVDLYKDGETGEIIDSVTTTLLPNTSNVLNFEIDDSYLNTNDSLDARTFYIKAETADLESDYGNNTETVNIYPDYEVNVVADRGGTVSGSGTYVYDTTTTITAIPNEGYNFYAWYENGHILYGTPATYEIEVDGNRNLKALFTIDPEYPATITGSVYQMMNVDGELGGSAPNLTLTLDNEYTTTTAENGSFKFENVLPGAYILTISGESTIDRTMLITVTDTEMSIGNIAVLCCDYVKDGIIDDQDKTVWQEWFSNSGGTIDNVFADINGDGFTNAKDFAMLIHFKGKGKDNIYADL